MDFDMQICGVDHLAGKTSIDQHVNDVSLYWSSAVFFSSRAIARCEAKAIKVVLIN